MSRNAADLLAYAPALLIIISQFAPLIESSFAHTMFTSCPNAVSSNLFLALVQARFDKRLKSIHDFVCEILRAKVIAYSHDRLHCLCFDVYWSENAIHSCTTHVTALSMHLQAAVADNAEGSAPAAAGKNKGSGPINGTSAAEKRKQVAAAEAAKKTPAAGECYVLICTVHYLAL